MNEMEKEIAELKLRVKHLCDGNVELADMYWRLRKQLEVFFKEDNLLQKDVRKVREFIFDCDPKCIELSKKTIKELLIKQNELYSEIDSLKNK